MSRLSDLPRPPAHAGVLPGAASYAPATAVEAAAVVNAIPGIAAVECLLAQDSPSEPARFFRAVRGAKAEPLFLKLMSESEYAAVAEADDIVRRLRDGAAVGPCGAFPLADGSRRVFVSYPYIDARFLEPTPADMRKLGAAIARLHAALRGIPDAAAVVRRARERAEGIDAALGRSDRYRRTLDAAGLPQLAPGVAFVVDRPDAQPLHGDLNAGNILCDRRTGRIHFLDFEDLRHTAGPVLHDLALPVERFCLLIDDEASALAAATGLFAGYAEAAGASPIAAPGALAEALRIVNLRAVGLLIQQMEAGAAASAEEWRKFGMLLSRHRERNRVIEAIEAASLG